MHATARLSRTAQVFSAFLALGLSSFGGPVAHLGYFRDAFVVRRQWLTERDYADLVALCQFLPGPASSQVGIAIGWLRAGALGALAAFVAFTLPSIVLLAAVALGTRLLQGPLAQSVLHGLQIAAVAVVALAAWQMATRLANTPLKAVLALAAAILMQTAGLPALQVGIIAGGGLIGSLFMADGRSSPEGPRPAGAIGPGPWLLLILFAILLAALPLFATLTGSATLDVASRFYRAGALVFGGGHVVLPLLEAELVAPGLIDRDTFLAGYGAAQAVPGPLFSVAFYAGMLLKTPPNGIAGGLLALAAIYVPSFLLVLGALPFWHSWRSIRRVRAALDGANAAVVGLLVAVLFGTAGPAAIRTGWDMALTLAALMALGLRLPPVLVVIGSAGLAALLGLA